MLVTITASLVLSVQLASAKEQKPKEVQGGTTTTTTSKEALGETLFNDSSLSLTRSQSCATCHNPEQGFSDERDNGVHGAVSLGDDGVTLGDRNSQMLTYSAFSPDFSDTNGFRGGQFWDGRAADLTEQAKGPFLNPKEMQMPDTQSVIARVSENPSYIEQFEAIYGENILDNAEEAFNAVADAIAAFEKSSSFATFDSKLDRARKREVRLTEEERLGQRLFTEKQCGTCHSGQGENALFTNFGYANIGVPKNNEVRIANGIGEDFIDHGLLDNPNIRVPRADGKFKIPSLRNVAVTAPYTHNGKFKNLKTMVHFYNTRDVAGAINPETSTPWEASEVLANRVAGDRIGNLGLSDSEEDALVAFLKTLTDERYEGLIP